MRRRLSTILSAVSIRVYSAIALAGLVVTLFTAHISMDDGIVVRLRWYHPLLLLPSVVWVLRQQSLRWEREQRECRRRAGLCPDCGYDLRATPQRCPECGKSAKPSAN